MKLRLIRLIDWLDDFLGHPKYSLCCRINNSLWWDWTDEEREQLRQDLRQPGRRERLGF